MFKVRVIPCLDVKDGRVVKGINFVNLRDAGDPVELAIELFLQIQHLRRALLGVLRAVDLVRVRSHGRHRFYRVNGAALRPVHDWVTAFERTWNERLNRLDDLLTELQEETP